jgi:hypothetical protein
MGGPWNLVKRRVEDLKTPDGVFVFTQPPTIEKIDILAVIFPM